MHNGTFIGEAWYGRHVVILTCNPLHDQMLHVFHSQHSPLEPVHHTCSQTLATFLSIGYQLANVQVLSQTMIQYVLIK
jgi:hypothetical protein